MKVITSFLQFINEQASANYRLGSTGAEVKAIQQKLIDLGLLKIAAPTGTFGNKTKAAVETFQKQNSLQVDGIVGKLTYPKLMGTSTATSQKDLTSTLKFKTEPTTSDTFAPYSDSARKSANITQKQLDDFRAGITPVLASPQIIPVHLRALLFFLNGKTDTFTNSDLTVEEQKTAGKMINWAIRNGIFKSGKSLDFYSLAGMMNTDGEKFNFKDTTLGVDQLDIKNETTRIGMTLGNATVTKVANGYLITDQYDYNNYYNHPEQYTLTAAPSTVLKAMKKLYQKNYVQGIESLLSFAHKAGYPGYPVKIMLTPSMVTGVTA